MCLDLVGASVIEHRVTDYKRSQECYRIVKQIDGVEACMELNLTKRTCVIWYPMHPSRETRFHEQNHCRGWAHTIRRRGGEIFYDWSPMSQLADVDGLLDPAADGADQERGGS